LPGFNNLAHYNTHYWTRKSRERMGMCISAHFFRKKERERKRQQRAGLLTAAITTTLSSGIGKGDVGLATPKTPGSVISEIRRFVMIGVRFADSWVGVEEWGARRRMAGEAREEQASNRMGSWTEEEEAYLHLDSLGDFLGIQKGEQTEISAFQGCRSGGFVGWTGERGGGRGRGTANGTV
jgi:hypothetical protein